MQGTPPARFAASPDDCYTDHGQGHAAKEFGMLRRIYDWVIALSASRYAMPALAAIAFAENSFFPIPPDAFIIPMVLAQPKRAWRIALIATVASVLGGLAGYAIGYYLQSFSQWLIGAQNFEAFRAAYAEWGLWIILIKRLTP